VAPCIVNFLTPWPIYFFGKVPGTHSKGRGEGDPARITKSREGLETEKVSFTVLQFRGRPIHKVGAILTALLRSVSLLVLSSEL
jgi:hypothetical protein